MKWALPSGDTGQERRQQVLLYLGYVAFFVFCFLMFAYLTFPYERLRDLLIERVSSSNAPGGTQTTLRIDELSPHWFTGIALEGVTIERSDSTEAGAAPATFTLDEVTLRAAPLAYLFGTIEVSFGVRSGDGTLSGRYETDKEGESKRVTAELDELELGKIGVGALLGMPLAGAASGTIELDLPQAATASAGELDLSITGLTLGDGKNKMKLPGMAGGLTLDAIDAGTLELKITIKEGVAALEKLQAQGKDLTLDGSGSIRLAYPLERSRADVTLGFQFDDGYRNRSDKTKIAFELLSSNPLMKSATGADGMTRLQLSGGVTMLRPRAAAPAAMPKAAAKPPKPKKKAASKPKASASADEDP